VLVAAAHPDEVAWLRGELEDRFDVTAVTSGAEALAVLDADRPQVLIVAERLADMAGAALVEQAAEAGGAVSLFLGDAGQAGEAPVYYALNRAVVGDDLRALVGSAAGQRPSGGGDDVSSIADARRVRRVLDLARRLAVQRDAAGAAQIAESAVLDLTGAERAYCLFHDPDSGELWSESESEEGERNAAAGLAGFAARTGGGVSAERADADPRYARAVDDPRGDGSERILAHAVAGGDGVVHAVLVAVRPERAAPFTDEARALLASFARQAGPLLHQLSLQVEADALIENQARDETGLAGDLFRSEAIEAYTAHREAGDVVRVSPVWVKWSYWFLLMVLLAGIVYASIGTVGVYSSGPAIVRMTGRTEITVVQQGSIESVLVVPGQRVREGQLLARFYDAEETAELDRLEQQFESQLVEFLRNPNDDDISRALAATRGEKERAEARLEERHARAPHDGVISDVRVRTGQHLAPGDVVLSLIRDDSDLSVIALLPGADRPQLRSGMKIRVELSGYKYAYQDLVIDTVSDEVVGPAEARRFLGSQYADTVSIGGPVVLVTMTLPSRTFEADDRSYTYHDGMQGTAEVKVRSERIITALVPGLRGL
jgi:membrane fusion protein (multidrug efflux system)